jgi:hypothetical protein
MLFLLRQVVHDPLALEMLRESLPAAASFLRAGITGGAAASGVIIRIVTLLQRFGLRLPCLQ